MFRRRFLSTYFTQSTMKFLHISFFALAVSAVFLTSSTCLAGPPFITDDPEPVDLHHYELYLGPAMYSRSNANDFLDAPFMEFNYGVLPDTQVHIIVNGAFNLARDPHQTHYGLGDTELGLKYRFIHESNWMPEIGVFPLIELSTGNRHEGLGNGQTQYFFPVWLQKSWGDWTVYGGGGFFYNPAPLERSFWRMGFVVQRDLSKQLTLGLEIFHETPASVGAGGHTAFNLGVIYNFNDNVHLLASAGRDIDGPSVFMSYTAVQFTW